MFGISCFSIDIDAISKIFKNLLHGSAGFSAPAFSKMVNILDVQNSEIYRHNICLKCFGNVWIFIRYPGVSEDKNNCDWEKGARPKVPISEKLRFLGSPISKSENL